MAVVAAGGRTQVSADRDQQSLDSGGPRPPSQGIVRRRLPVGGSLFTLLLLVVAFFVIAPIGFLIVTSFQVGNLGQVQHWGLENWQRALADPKIGRALSNTFQLSLEREAIALVLGVFVAWLIARTNMPGREWLEFGFWVAVFMPQLTVTLAWTFILGDHGVVNQFLGLQHLVKIPPLNVYSWGGIIFIHLMTVTFPIKIMLLAPAFRNLDANLELASLASGASLFRTFRRIVVPMIFPALLVVTVLGLIASLQAFEIEYILGFPAGINVYSTQIYQFAEGSPPLLGEATVLGLLILGILLPLIAFQQWHGSRREHLYAPRAWGNSPVDLGPFKWVAFAFVGVLVLMMTILPIITTVMGTFMKLFGIFTPQTWTTRNWSSVFSNSSFLTSLRNTLAIGLTTAIACMVLLSLLAYVTVRSRFRLRRALDFMTWLPSALPGIIMGLGYLWIALSTPLLRNLYGTWAILALVLVLSNMTLTTQIIRANLVQLGKEVEEASYASGADWLFTFRRVTLPLIAPAIAVVGLLSFSSATKATAQIALLSSGSNEPISMLQLAYMAEGRLEPASVIGTIVLALTIGLALLARLRFSVRLR